MNRRLVLLAALMVSAIAAGPVEAAGSRGQVLRAVIGQGAGIVNVTPTPTSTGFSAEIIVNVHGTAPDTTFLIERAPELGRPLGDDGICQRANELYPWEQPFSDGFSPVPAFIDANNATLTTDANGDGAAHFAFAVPAIPDGTVFDVQFRLVDSHTAPTTDLRTGCFTITVK